MEIRGQVGVGGLASLCWFTLPSRERARALGAPGCMAVAWMLQDSRGCPFFTADQHGIPRHSCCCNWVPLGKCAVLFGGSPHHRPHARWSRVSAAAVTKARLLGSATLSPPPRLETSLCGRESLAPFLTLPSLPQCPPPTPQMEPVPWRPHNLPRAPVQPGWNPSFVRLDEEINLSELSGHMGIARSYSASAVDSLAPITVIATLLLSVLETMYLWLHQLGRWPSSK